MITPSQSSKIGSESALVKVAMNCSMLWRTLWRLEKSTEHSWQALYWPWIWQVISEKGRRGYTGYYCETDCGQSCVGDTRSPLWSHHLSPSSLTSLSHYCTEAPSPWQSLSSWFPQYGTVLVFLALSFELGIISIFKKMLTHIRCNYNM